MSYISKKKHILIVCIVVAVCLALVITAGASSFLFYKKYAKLIEIDRIVRDNYYWQIDENDLSDAICEGYIDGLNDKYSYYKNVDETNDKKLDTQGKAIGIGVYVIKNPDNYNIVVTNVMDNSPASKAGIQALDEIVAINGSLVEDVGYEDAIDMIKGKVGDKVSLTLLRDGKQLTKELVREEYTTQNVFYRIIDGVGYIKVVSFDNVTFKQFEIAVDYLLEQDVRGIIFDLQGNAGGTFDAMEDMLDILCPKDELITIEYADGTRVKACSSDEEEVNLPMAVLVDGGSASASELFASTLRDYGKAVLIGEKTYGKCVMQRSYGLKDGTSIRITVAKCITKSGFDFNGIGLTPDVEIELTEQQATYYYRLSDEENPHIKAAVEWINKQ